MQAQLRLWIGRMRLVRGAYILIIDHSLLENYFPCPLFTILLLSGREIGCVLSILAIKFVGFIFSKCCRLQSLLAEIKSASRLTTYAIVASSVTSQLAFFSSSTRSHRRIRSALVVD